MLKNKKMIISFVLVVILVVALSTTAFAYYHSKAEIIGTTGTDYGDVHEMYGMVRNRGENEERSDSVDICAYVLFDNQFQKKHVLTRGEGMDEWYSLVGYADTDCQAVLEAIWGNQNWGYHEVLDY